MNEHEIPEPRTSISHGYLFVIFGSLGFAYDGGARVQMRLLMPQKKPTAISHEIEIRRRYDRQNIRRRGARTRDGARA